METQNVSLEKIRACKKKALEVVESLLENSISEEYLISMLPYIRKNEYKDVIQERAIIKNCGYPLCRQVLNQVKSQKYHISLTRRKVYDITERKMFCSDECYTASKYLEQQLLTSPLWIEENLGDVKLLPCCHHPV